MEHRWIIDTRIGTRFPAYTRGNAADVLPDPITPLMWTLYWTPAISTGGRDAFIAFGIIDWDEFEDANHPDVFGCFGGYFYNPLSMTRLMGVRMPGATPDVMDKAYLDDRPDAPPYLAEPWHDSPANAAKLTESMQWVMSTPTFPELDADSELASPHSAA